VCVLSSEPADDLGGAVCVPTASVAEGGLSVQSASHAYPGTELVTGVMPDGIQSVSLHLATGGSLTVPVHQNVYSTLVKAAIGSITGTGSAGTLTVEGLSASAAAAHAPK
jgi:hypothetical protein